MHLYRGEVHEGQPAEYTPKLAKWAEHRQAQGRRFSQTVFDVFKDAERVGTCTLNSRGNEPEGVEIPWPSEDVDYLHCAYEPAEGANVLDLFTEEQKEMHFTRIVTQVIEDPELGSAPVAMITSVGGLRS